MGRSFNNMKTVYEIQNDCLQLVRKYQMAVENLTEQQLAEAIKQALASGEFMRNVTTDGRQAVTYIPWREVEILRENYNELLYAVVNVYKDETRHETALRYIKEHESYLSGCSSIVTAPSKTSSYSTKTESDSPPTS